MTRSWMSNFTLCIWKFFFRNSCNNCETFSCSNKDNFKLLLYEKVNFEWLNRKYSSLKSFSFWVLSLFTFHTFRHISKCSCLTILRLITPSVYFSSWTQSNIMRISCCNHNEFILIVDFFEYICWLMVWMTLFDIFITDPPIINLSASC